MKTAYQTEHKGSSETEGYKRSNETESYLVSMSDCITDAIKEITQENKLINGMACKGCTHCSQCGGPKCWSCSKLTDKVNS